MLKELRDFIRAFGTIKSTPQHKWNENIFQVLRIYLTQLILDAIITNKTLNRGPKPKPETVNKFLNAFFELCDNGSKFTYLIRHHHISSDTFYRLFKVLMAHQLFQKLHQNLLNGAIIEDINLLDSTHLRSLDGSDGVGYGFKEKGKKAVKLTVLTSVGKVIYLHSLNPDNVADTVAFKSLSHQKPVENMPLVLADKGYDGTDFKKECLKNGYNVISPPKNYKKKKKKRRKSNIVSENNLQKLKEHRCKVEHVFKQLKSYSGIQIKRVRKISHFDCLVNLAILIISIHNGIIREGLKPKTLLKIRKKG